VRAEILADTLLPLLFVPIYAKSPIV
jgi:hypothetical protein